MHREINVRTRTPRHGAAAAADRTSDKGNATDPASEPRQMLRQRELTLRIEDLERQANFGLCAFMVLGDLLNNVRSNGGMTSEVIDNTFAELVDYFQARTSGRQHPIVKYVQSMWCGDATP